MLESYYPIKQIAKKVGISIQTAFDWRHKILSGTIKDDKSFKGIPKSMISGSCIARKAGRAWIIPESVVAVNGPATMIFRQSLLITADATIQQTCPWSVLEG
jgi:hypothetical protein